MKKTVLFKAIAGLALLAATTSYAYHGGPHGRNRPNPPPEQTEPQWIPPGQWDPSGPPPPPQGRRHQAPQYRQQQTAEDTDNTHLNSQQLLDAARAAAVRDLGFRVWDSRPGTLQVMSRDEQSRITVRISNSKRNQTSYQIVVEGPDAENLLSEYKRKLNDHIPRRR